MTVKRVEETYSFSPRTIYRLIADGRLRSTTIGRRRLIFVDSIEEVLAGSQ
jgi:excisionase family DNA binding protein